MQYSDHIIGSGLSIKFALTRLNELAGDAIVFVVNVDGKLIGSLTDGDVRRGFIRGLNLDSKVTDFIQPSPKYIRKGGYTITDLISHRESGFRILPLVDENDIVVDVINFRYHRSYLPLDAVIMAGGKGERLKPLTDSIPKPLLDVGGKAIIEHNIDRAKNFGIQNIWVSIKYLGEMIMESLGDGTDKMIKIRYVEEKDPLGTAGALALISDIEHDAILVMNSDLLTNINLEDFYLFFEKNDVDMAIACIPYQVDIPYAVMETDGFVVKGFKEKPSYTYYSNAGIYIIRKKVLELIPKNKFFNATDLMNKLLKEGRKVMAYPLVGYWLDIGRPEDYKKAQDDIKYLEL